MSFDREEFEGYLLINKFKLDDEVMRQSQLYHEVGKAHAEAIAIRDNLEERLAVVDAEIDAELRKKHESEETKYTEPLIKNEVRLDKRHQKAFATYIAAKEEAGKTYSLQNAYDHRRSMIERLCKLYEGEYWNNDSVRGDAAADRVQYSAQRKRMTEARKRQD